MRERLTPVATACQGLSQLLPINTAFLSARDLDELPNGRMLAEGATIFDRLSGELQAVANSLASIGAEFIRLRQQELRPLRKDALSTLMI
jgi:hypothetical protein